MPTPTFIQYSQLLQFYVDLDLALKCNPDVNEYNALDFTRQFIRGKIDNSNAHWLSLHINQKLKIKTKSFLTNVKHDYNYLLTVAAMNYELSSETDAIRFNTMLNSISKKMLTATPKTDEIAIKPEDQTSFMKKGLFFALNEHLLFLDDIERLNSSDEIKTALIAQSPQIFYTVIEILAKFGFTFDMPKFSRGKKHEFVLRIDHNSEEMKTMVEIGRNEMRKLDIHTTE